MNLRRSFPRKVLIIAVVLVISGVAWAFYRTFGRTIIQFDIRQNQELIYLSAFAEPPQFAIWIENPETYEIKTVFVTRRAGVGDWEGKPHVPVALPRWFELANMEEQQSNPKENENNEYLAVTGATPKDDYFSIRVEVPPGSRWICWVEMNLSGDYNEAFPERDVEKMYEDEFGCGQPALLFRAEIVAEAGMEVEPELYAQSIWQDGVNRVEPVSAGVTSARDVFSDIHLKVLKPKPKLIES